MNFTWRTLAAHRLLAQARKAEARFRKGWKAVCKTVTSIMLTPLLPLLVLTEPLASSI